MGVAVVVLATLLALLAAAWAGDQLARRRHWRLGHWTQRVFGGRAWQVQTRFGPVVIHGGCERCGTSWRYVDPWLIPVRPYGELAVIYAFCEECHKLTPAQADRDRPSYLRWWLDRRDAIEEEGTDPLPDAREWAEIEAALRVHDRPDRVMQL